MSFTVQTLIINVSKEMRLLNTNNTEILVPAGQYTATHCPGTTKSFDLRNAAGEYIAKVEINIDRTIAYIS